MSKGKTYSEIKNIVFQNYSELNKTKQFLRGIKDMWLYKDQTIDNDYKILMQLNDLEHKFQALTVPKDGNCFYNSLSLFYFGTTTYFYIFKICLLYVLVENEQIIQNFLKKRCKYTHEEYLESLENSVKEQEWADFINISTATILLKRPISIISLSSQNIPFKTVYGIPDQNCGILIGFYKNHFVPLLKVNENVKEPNNESMTVFDKFDRFKV
jgi:hypothetical protein